MTPALVHCSYITPSRSAGLDLVVLSIGSKCMPYQAMQLSSTIKPALDIELSRALLCSLAKPRSNVYCQVAQQLCTNQALMNNFRIYAATEMLFPRFCNSMAKNMLTPLLCQSLNNVQATCTSAHLLCGRRNASCSTVNIPALHLVSIEPIYIAD